MTKRTHLQGGMLCSIIGFLLLKYNGLLLPDIHESLQWLVMYPFTYWASVAPDLDHHWGSSPARDYASWFVHRILHFTRPLEKFIEKSSKKRGKDPKKNKLYKLAYFLNPHHRSWQTHSELTILVMLGILYCLLSGKVQVLTSVEYAIVVLILTGIIMGSIAHILLDILTVEGIWLVGCVIINWVLHKLGSSIKLPERFKLVPKTKNKFFKTGETWEGFVQKVLKFLTVVALVWVLSAVGLPILRDILPFEITFS